MTIDDWPNLKDYAVARSAPMLPLDPKWLVTMIERVVAANGRVRPRISSDIDLKLFWFLPAVPLAMWTPTTPYGLWAHHWVALSGFQLDSARLDDAYEFARRIPGTAALGSLEVNGFVNEARRGKPHVTIKMARRFEGSEWRGRQDDSTVWSVSAWFHEAHPALKAGGDDALAEVIAPAVAWLDPIDVPIGQGGRSLPFEPTRSGLTDSDAAYRLFRDVVAALVPRPTAWGVGFSFDAHQWADWTDSLNEFEPSWCFGGYLLPDYDLALAKRPSYLHPARPLRIPIAAWKLGPPPRLQMNIVHAVEGSWLEFETLKGRKNLEELNGLIPGLEFWDGPPHLRWR